MELGFMGAGWRLLLNSAGPWSQVWAITSRPVQTNDRYGYEPRGFGVTQNQENPRKSCEKVHFSESWICNPLTPVQSKHTFLCLRFGRKNDQKSLPKASQNRPKIIKKRLSSLSRIHAEKAEMQNAKNAKKCRKMTSKRDYFFVAEVSPKSQKSEVSSKWAPRPPKWAPGPPKSLKIMRVWSPKIKKILEKKTSRNGTVAGYARSALDRTNHARLLWMNACICHPM